MDAGDDLSSGMVTVYRFVYLEDKLNDGRLCMNMVVIAKVHVGLKITEWTVKLKRKIHKTCVKQL